MKKLTTSIAVLALALTPVAAAAQQAPAAPAENKVELSVRDLIPEGFVSQEPVVSRVGPSVRRSYFIHRAPGPDSWGYYKVPLILVETLDGKVIAHETLGDKWGWTGIRPGRSVGLGDPHHDVELREFTNGRDARLVGLADGYMMQISRDGETVPFVVKPTKGFEVQLGTIDGNFVLVEIAKNKPTIYTLRSTTFYPDPALSKKAATRGLARLGFWSAWSSRTTEQYAASAPEPAKAPAPATETKPAPAAQPAP